MIELFKKGLMTLAALVLLAAPSVFAATNDSANEAQGSSEQIGKKVRRELVTLPHYGVFDNLAYKIEGDTVTLYGQVVQPSTRRDAERRVARIAGVRNVVNNIEVLPLSGMDDRIRVSTYREIRRMGSLYRYFLGSNPSLHIVVKHGHITLEGVVATEGDRRLAYMAARSVQGAFSVTNNLRTDRGGRY